MNSGQLQGCFCYGCSQNLFFVTGCLLYWTNCFIVPPKSNGSNYRCNSTQQSLPKYSTVVKYSFWYSAVVLRIITVTLCCYSIRNGEYQYIVVDCLLRGNPYASSTEEIIILIVVVLPYEESPGFGCTEMAILIPPCEQTIAAQYTSNRNKMPL